MNIEQDFRKCTTLEELKKLYFGLMKRWHPDVGGDLETAKIINNLYDKYFPLLKNYRKDYNGNTYQKDTTEAANEFRDIVDAIIHYKGLKIEVCGTWLWVSGKTKPVKEDLKELGLKWSQNKEAWYYTRDEKKKKYHRPWDMEKIRASYGSQTIKEEEPA